MALRTVVIEDNEDVVRLVRVWLRLDDRFELVGTATDGRRGVELCAHAQPDAVLIDVNMPELDGIAAISEIRKLSPRSRIVVFSSDPTTSQPALTAGADAWHLKTDAMAQMLDLLAGDALGGERS